MAAGDQFLKHLVVDRGTIADAEKQSQWASKKLVWVPHTDQGYVSGSIKVSYLFHSQIYYCIASLTGLLQSFIWVCNTYNLFGSKLVSVIHHRASPPFYFGPAKTNFNFSI